MLVILQALLILANHRVNIDALRKSRIAYPSRAFNRDRSQSLRRDLGKSRLRHFIFGGTMGQKVLITAAASGIGLEIARAFVSAGATVFISDINTQAIDAAKKEIPGLLSSLCDNSKRSDIEAMVPAAVKALGGLDVLVNNAGISGPTAPVEEVD